MDGRSGWFRGALLHSIGVFTFGASADGCVKDSGPERPPLACADPMPGTQLGPAGEQPTGWEHCSNGFSHRPEQRACLYHASVVGSCMMESSEGDACSADADCTDRPHGYCNDDAFNYTCSCNYGCVTDDDCGEDQACYCSGAQSHCVAAYCHTDDDCEAGYLCSLENGILACHSPADGCRVQDDCPDGSCPICAYEAEQSSWQCEPEAGFCTIGRPFLVDGRARTADTITRTDWCAATLACTEPELDIRTRAVLARHWSELALAEHASVPAFARFALELVALAAPADLVVECARAMSDEIEHARLAFALASRYAGEPVGPGALATGDALARRTDLLAVADAVIHEACIGESLAAIEAAAARDRAVDADVRRTLARIADDELRHAQLGWRFLAWALAQADAHQAAQLRSTCARALQLARAELVVATDPGSRAAVEHGWMDADTRNAVRREAIDEVIAPVFAALHARAPTMVQRVDACAS